MQNAKESSWLCEAALLYCYTACLATVFSILASPAAGRFTTIGFGPWLISVLFCFFLCRLFLRRERSGAQLLRLIIGWLAVQTVVLFLFFSDYTGFMLHLIALVFFCLIAYVLYSIYLNGIKLSSLSTILELQVFLLVLAILYHQFMEGVPQSLLYPLSSGILISLIGLVAMRTAGGRTEGSSRTGGIAVLAIVLALLSIFMLAFLLLASDAVGDTVLAVINFAVSAGKKIGAVIGALIVAFFNLFPEAEGGELGDMEPVDTMSQAINESMKSETSVYAVVITVAVLCAVLISVYLYHTRRMKIGVHHVPARSFAKRSSPGFLALLRRAAQNLCFRIKFFFLSTVYRNTAPGTLLYLERWGALHHQKRGEGETHRAFLLRLAAGEDAETAALLKTLANCLDIQFYRGVKCEFARENSKALRHIFSAGKTVKTV